MPAKKSYKKRAKKRARMDTGPTSALAPPRTGGFYSVDQRAALAAQGKIERKAIDVDRAAYVGDTTGSVTLLNGVATGTDFTNRIGRRILMKSLYVRGFVFPIDSTVVDNLSRVIIVYDSQVNGAIPAITDILKEAFSESQINLNNRDRFHILADKTFQMGSVNNTATQAYQGSPTVHKFKIFKKLNLEVIFGGTTNLVASIQTGALWMVTIGNVGANAGSDITATSRVRFIDA